MTEPEYASLDMSLFETYRTESNNMAKVVRSSAGGYLSMSNNLGQRRLCYMHQLSTIKPCEVPLCSRYLFPQTHVESEMIGKVHWVSGDNTQMLTQYLKVRPLGLLYACKLCLTRSQSTVKARQLLKDLKTDVDNHRAREAAARRVRGITEVPQIKDAVAVVDDEKHGDGADGVTVDGASGFTVDDNLETEAELLSACSPPKFEIRQRPVPLRKPELAVNKASIRKSLLDSYPSLSVKDVNDGSTEVTNRTDVSNPSRQTNTNTELLKLFVDNDKSLPAGTSRPCGTDNELRELFAEDSLSLAKSLMKTMKGARNRVKGTSVSPNSKELLDDNHVEDFEEFEGEVFSSGSEPYEDQMERIHNDFKLKQHEDRKVSNKNVDKGVTRGVIKADMKGNNMLLRNRGSKLKSSLKPPANVENVNDINEDASERLDEQDEDISVDLAAQDEDASVRSVRSIGLDGYASESLDEQEEVEQDEVEQKVDELQGDSLVSDYDRSNESNESLELNDAQSLGVGSDNDLDDDTEGYVPLPMSEEQAAEQLSEQRDNGDFE